jgi:hypothetical protein
MAILLPDKLKIIVTQQALEFPYTIGTVMKSARHPATYSNE